MARGRQRARLCCDPGAVAPVCSASRETLGDRERRARGCAAPHGLRPRVQGRTSCVGSAACPRKCRSAADFAANPYRRRDPRHAGHRVLGRSRGAGRDGALLPLSGPGCGAYRRHRHRARRAAYPGSRPGSRGRRSGRLEAAIGASPGLSARHLGRQHHQPQDPRAIPAYRSRRDARADRRQARAIDGTTMYLYDEIDQRLVDERVAQFHDQTKRFLAGKLSEDEFRALRLRNGLYIQRYAPMLRIAIPYGLLSTRQLRKLAEITRKYDRGYGHFSTRQNLQLNWPKLPQAPDILAELATVQMHAIQTSGNSFRNVTTDHFAGVARDEIVDSFVWCEIIRQWSTFHPEFSYLPRKFKFAVNGAKSDRAAVAVHDIGLHALRDEKGEVGFRVLVGGGLGRTPAIGFVIREFLPWRHLLTYIEAILRVYNRYGRRDNIHKARIK